MVHFTRTQNSKFTRGPAGKKSNSLVLRPSSTVRDGNTYWTAEPELLA